MIAQGTICVICVHLRLQLPLQAIAALCGHLRFLSPDERFLAQMSVGPMPHAKIMRSIELFGALVAPVVRRETARSETPSGV